MIRSFLSTRQRVVTPTCTPSSVAKRLTSSSRVLPELLLDPLREQFLLAIIQPWRIATSVGQLLNMPQSRFLTLELVNKSGTHTEGLGYFRHRFPSFLTGAVNPLTQI